MAEDIVERAERFVIRRETISHDEYGARKAIGLLAESSDALSECIATIESLRARLATEHALGFKAGIEAAVADIQNHMDNLGHQSAFAIEAKYNKIFDYSVNAWGVVRDIRNSVSSLPTPPSPLSEILEAMRPVARAVDAVDQLYKDAYPQPTSATLDINSLRAIAAVFTKLGGKL